MSRKPVARKGTLAIAVIGDEPTVTGFLLAGIGERHAKYGTNFLIVDKGTNSPLLTLIQIRPNQA